MKQSDLTTLRRIMLRTAFEHTIHLSRNGAQEESFRQPGIGLIDGVGSNALRWLIMNGWCQVPTVNTLGFMEGEVLLTDKGRAWLAEFTNAKIDKEEAPDAVS